jgi:putative ABC transport system permease protein
MEGLFARARSLWGGLRRQERVDAEMDEEMRFHLEMEAERLVREKGLDPREARRRAAVAFGGVEKYKEAGRDARGLTWPIGLSLDFKLGARMLAKYPGLTLVGGLSMAVAIAVGAAAFEMVNQAVHPTLPLDDGGRVVGIRNWDAAANRVQPQALHDFATWRQELRSVEDVSAFRSVTRNLISADGDPQPLEVAEMTASGFHVAREAPLLGRTLVEEDERPGAPTVVVIGHDVWRSRFGGDPRVVGRTIRIGRSEATVVGVMRKGFAFPVSHTLWMPLRLNPLEHERGSGPGISVFGRLARGASLDAAQAELSTLGRRAAADFPRTHQHLRPQVMPYARSWSPSPGEGIPWRALTAAGYAVNVSAVMFLLLICANVATLVFARTATRESEIAMRSALGASRRRIATQLFAEALVLGGVAAAVGLAVAAVGLRWGLGVFETVAMDLPFWFRGRISLATVLYAAVLTVVAALIAGAVPALKITGRGMQTRLRQAGMGGASMRFGRLWTGIIVTQVALTVAFVPLVVDAALDTRQIGVSELGFPAGEYVSARVEMDREDAAGPELGEQFRASLQELERRLAAEPGVTAVTFARVLPGAYHRRRAVEVEGVAGPTPQERVQTGSVDPRLFDALGAPILAGRGLSPADVESGAAVVVNEEFVRVVLGGRSAVGRRVRYVDPEEDDDPAARAEPGPWLEIVGVVRQLGMTIDPDLDHAAGIYHPLAPGAAFPLHVAVRVTGAPEAFAPRLRALAVGVDPDLRLYEVGPMDQVQRDLLMTYTFWVGVAALAACIVLLLSTTGIYSLMSFTVARRTREIGIRIALGADRRRIVSGIFSRAFTQVGLGIAIGAGLLVLAAGGIQSVGEAGVIAAIVGVMTGVCMLACIVPTRRALRVEPTEAMRADA